MPGRFTLENYPCDEDGHDCDGQHIKRGMPGSWIFPNASSDDTSNASGIFALAEDGDGDAATRRWGGKRWEWEKHVVKDDEPVAVE